PARPAAAAGKDAASAAHRIRRDHDQADQRKGVNMTTFISGKPDRVPLPMLDRLEIATPCTMRFEDMPGDERVRHCRHCNLNVYNLSAMSRKDAEELVIRNEGR